MDKIVCLTFIFNVFIPVQHAHCPIESSTVPIQWVIKEGSDVYLKGRIVWGPLQAFVPQVAHEELQPDEREHAQTEHGQDHDVRELLHRLDQGAHDGLQAYR